ncbi:AhpD family alkylhydroperoxidase [Thermocatellispora tengchongensis]|uniref:AhpD family alkylhydroperoxidase n=1 Tax=Thermocatellispora tengchongensis TaxID=1073253 RepID=A0A840P661_9ACTN|nr:carboxymuconolactone decarboxylase family protein [Thermocatellispora tengchongensis]MBB5135158.1 AhpD family alkylhydroperoxidase [Thermocatellispora tengchongensis]
MTPRINIAELAPKGYQAMLGVEMYLANSRLPKNTLGLVKLRASQINGCSFCVDMHAHELKKEGESDERLWSVAAWRESPYFTEAERAALALCEEVTRLADRGETVPDPVWQEAEKHFAPEVLADLVLALALINAWNRIAVTCRTVPGSYRK